MIAKERHLFPDFSLWKTCRRCGRKLHCAKHYRTRSIGLCFVCVRAFDRADTWQVETFCKTGGAGEMMLCFSRI